MKENQIQISIIWELYSLFFKRYCCNSMCNFFDFLKFQIIEHFSNNINFIWKISKYRLTENSVKFRIIQEDSWKFPKNTGDSSKIWNRLILIYGVSQIIKWITRNSRNFSEVLGMIRFVKFRGLHKSLVNLTLICKIF